LAQTRVLIDEQCYICLQSAQNTSAEFTIAEFCSSSKTTEITDKLLAVKHAVIMQPITLAEARANLSQFLKSDKKLCRGRLVHISSAFLDAFW